MILAPTTFNIPRIDVPSIMYLYPSFETRTSQSVSVATFTKFCTASTSGNLITVSVNVFLLSGFQLSHNVD